MAFLLHDTLNNESVCIQTFSGQSGSTSKKKERSSSAPKLDVLIKKSVFEKKATPPTFNRAPVAQLVEHRAVTREVVSSTPAGPTLRVFK